MSFPKKEFSSKDATKYFFNYLRAPKIKGLWPTFLFICSNMLAWDFISYPVSKVVGKVSQTGKIEAGPLLNYVYLIMGCILVGESLARVSAYFQRRIVQRKVTLLYNECFKIMLEKSQNYFNDNFVGSITSKISRFANSFEQFARTFYFQFGILASSVLYAIIILGTRNPLALLVFFTSCLLIVLLLKKPFKKRSIKAYNASKATSEVTAKMVDAFSNISVIKATSNLEAEQKRFLKSTEELEKVAIQYWDYSNRFIAFPMSIFIVLNYGLSLLFAVLARAYWGAAPDTVYLTTSIFFTLSIQYWEMTRIYQDMQAYLASGVEALEMLNEENDDKYRLQKVKKIKLNTSNIEIDNISFKYEKSNKYLFRNFSLKIPDGQKIGIVGHSGVGKSTLVKLLMGFGNLDDGKILIDGQDIAVLNDKYLKEIISYVPQESSLFHRSILENISYGIDEYSQSRLDQVSEMSYVNEFISKLPNGYDTLVGERGIKLSGGQRQRIAIARAMLRKSKLLILDEATSSLDSQSESYIQEALLKLMEGKTVVAIAHRLSTISHLDRIIVLDKGQIVQDGTHDQLVKESGLYKTLWQHQSGGYLGE